MDKKKESKTMLSIIGIILVAFGFFFGPDDGWLSDTETLPAIGEETVVEGQSYNTPVEVAEYIDLYGELPDNYLTKNEARELGWDAKEGNLWNVAPGASIGGDYFGNFEEALPEEKNRDYYEADIEYMGGHRNAKRLVFSNDGLYFYTDDHYDSFQQVLVGEDE